MQEEPILKVTVWIRSFGMFISMSKWCQGKNLRWSFGLVCVALVFNSGAVLQVKNVGTAGTGDETGGG